MIKTFEEAEREIRKLRDELDSLKKGNIDARQRRIVNAAPSQDSNDVVIRAELAQFLKPTTQEVQTKATGSAAEEVCVFGAFVGSVAVDSQNCCPPHLVKKSGSFRRVYAALKEPYIAGSFNIVLRKNEQYLTNLNDGSIIIRIDLPEQQEVLPIYAKESSFFTSNDNFNFVPGDIITIDITGVGTTFPGGGLIVKFVY